MCHPFPVVFDSKKTRLDLKGLTGYYSIAWQISGSVGRMVNVRVSNNEVEYARLQGFDIMITSPRIFQRTSTSEVMFSGIKKLGRRKNVSLSVAERGRVEESDVGWGSE